MLTGVNTKALSVYTKPATESIGIQCELVPAPPLVLLGAESQVTDSTCSNTQETTVVTDEDYIPDSEDSTGSHADEIYTE